MKSMCRQSGLFLTILFIIMPIFSFSAESLSSSMKIGILPYQIESDNSNMLYLFRGVSELIGSKIHYSSPWKVVSYKSMSKTLSTLGISVSESISEENALKLSRYLDLDYLLTGEIKLKDNRLELRSKLLDGKTLKQINTALEVSVGSHSLYNLIDNNLDKLFSSWIKFDNTIKATSLLPVQHFDIALILNTTAGMKEEIKTLGENIRIIREYLLTLNYSARFRFAIVTFHSIASSGSVKIKDFNDHVIEAEQELLRLPIEEENPYLPNMAEAVLKAVQKLSWRTGQNVYRYAFLVTQTKHAMTKNEWDTMTKAKEMAKQRQIAFFVLACNPMLEKEKQFLTDFSLSTNGEYRDISYCQRLPLKSGQEKTFIFQNGNVYEQIQAGEFQWWKKSRYLNRENLQDITMGRVVHSPETMAVFLQAEGFPLRSGLQNAMPPLDNNLDELMIQQLRYQFAPASTDAPVPFIRFSQTGFNPITQIIGTEQAYRKLSSIPTGSKIYIGGRIVPTQNPDKFNLDPTSLIIETDDAYISGLSIKTLQQFKNEPYFHEYNGITDNNIWFVEATLLDKKGITDIPPSPVVVVNGNEVVINLGEIFFDFNVATLRQDSVPTLEKISAAIKKLSYYRIKVDGHTDDVGSDAINLDFSEKRAKSVSDFLIMQGLNPDYIVKKGYGESRPVVPNTSVQNRQLNRRVELIIETKEQEIDQLRNDLALEE